MKHFRANADRWQEGRFPARQRRKLFAIWVCDAVDALMIRRDIITRAFRGTGVGIDVDGIERMHIRFPAFDTYVPPSKNEEYLIDPLTKKEIDALAAQEALHQKAIKARKEAERKEAKRQRAIQRMNNL